MSITNGQGETRLESRAGEELAGENRARENRAWRPRWLIWPVLMFAISRIGIFSIAYFSLRIDASVQTSQPPVGSNLLVTALTRWDGGWFIRIARSGYTQPIDANFFPLLPLCGRYLSQLTGLSIAASLVLCANFCSFIGLCVVYRIFLELEDGKTAAAALTLLVAWPFSFFGATAYPESMMMLSSATAILLAMRRKHFAAGTALGIGILARHLTVLAGLSLLAQQIKDRGLHLRKLIFHLDFVALFLPPVIASIYFAFLAQRFGDWHAWLGARRSWGGSAWWGVVQFFTQPAVRQPEVKFYMMMSMIPGIGAIALLTRSRWRVLGAFAVAIMLLLWAFGAAGLGRYSAACWPAFLPLGRFFATRRGLFYATVLVFAVLQGASVYLFAHLFPIM